MISALLIPAAYAARPEDVGYVDSAGGRVRCHYERESAAARCEEVVVWAEEAWAAQVDGLGFRAPLPDEGRGGSDALDIYLTTEAGGAGSAWVDCDGGDPNCVDDGVTDGFAASPSYVVIDPRTSDEDFAHFVHHEFQHTTQYATDYAEPFLSLWEATAVAAERWTDPSWTTSADDLADYQAAPWASAILQDGYFLTDLSGVESWYEYGAVAWIWFMDERYGDGAGSIGPAIWAAVAQEGRGDEPDVLDAWEGIAGGWELSMLEFAAERARMGTDAGPEWAAFAGELGYAWREGLVELSEFAELTPTLPPYPLGTSYWEVVVEPGRRLNVEVDGDPGVRWGIVVVDDGETITAEDGFADFSAVGQGITIGVVNLGPNGFDADDTLEPASFRLMVTERGPDVLDGDNGGGCGCAGADRGGALAGLLALGLAARRRR